MEIFWRKGYGATTPQDLVDAIGIGKGSLYNAFGSKRALFELALRRYRDRQAKTVEELLNEPGPVKQRLKAALSLMIEANFADPDRRGCLAVNTAAELAGSDARATDQVREMFERTAGAFRAAIQAGQVTGEIRADLDADAAATHLLTTLVGLQLLSKTATRADHLQQAVGLALAPL